MKKPTMLQHDGAVLSSNLKIANEHGRAPKFNNYALYKAMITDIIPIDDERNIFKQGVEYQAVIVGGPREGEVLNSVIPLDGMGGKDNFSEIVYTPKKEVLNGKGEGDATPPEDTDGSYVLVGFLGGHYNHPVILGGWAQPNNETYGATIEDGTLARGKFNEMTWKLDKDGVLVISRKGTTITVDTNTDGVTIDSDKKIKLNTTNKVEITASQNIDITATTNVNITGNSSVNITGSSSVNIDGASIFLGSGAGESMVLGDALATLFNLHTHNENGSITDPPNQTIGGSQLSSIVKVK